MRRTSSLSTSITSAPRGRPRASDTSPVLAELRARFAEFRQDHPARTRVPVELRQAALAALKRGVRPGALYRACGVGWGQIAAWKRARGSTSAKPRAVEPSDVRVLSVVDDPRTALTSAPSHDLQLRLGPWAISVRLVDAERG